MAIHDPTDPTDWWSGALAVMTGFMLDTNLFNRLVDEFMPGKCVPRPTYVTHIQHDEIQNTKDPVRRAALLDSFSQASAQSIPTESAVFGVSRWGQSKFGASDGLFSRMLEALGALNKSKANNIQDILIAETALRNGFTLVTDDTDLTIVVRRYGGRAISSCDYLHG